MPYDFLLDFVTVVMNCTQECVLLVLDSTALSSEVQCNRLNPLEISHSFSIKGSYQS